MKPFDLYTEVLALMDVKTYDEGSYTRFERNGKTLFAHWHRPTAERVALEIGELRGIDGEKELAQALLIELMAEIINGPPFSLEKKD